MTNYSLIHTHLRNVGILVTKRLEILSYLHVLDNENYDFVDNNLAYFEKLSSQAKKLRVEVKSAHMSKKKIWTPLVAEAVQQFLDEVDQQVTTILKDVLEVRNRMARTINLVNAQLVANRMNEIISLDTQPISVLIKELGELEKAHIEIRPMIMDLVKE